MAFDPSNMTPIGVNLWAHTFQTIPEGLVRYFFSLLLRSAINAVTVIPLITLLISWPVFAVTVTKSSYSNLPTLGPSAAHLSRKQMLGKTNLLKNFWVFWCWHKFLKIVSEFAKKKLNWKKNLLKNIEKLEKIFEIEKDCHKNLKQWDNIFELEMIFKRNLNS